MLFSHQNKLEQTKENNYVESENNNNFKHFGSVDNKKITFYTDPIETRLKNLRIKNPAKDKFLIDDAKDENANRILANLTINLNKNILITEEITKNNIKYNVLTKEKTEKKFIQWVEENQNNLNNKSFRIKTAIGFGVGVGANILTRFAVCILIFTNIKLII